MNSLLAKKASAALDAAGAERARSVRVGAEQALQDAVERLDEAIRHSSAIADARADEVSLAVSAAAAEMSSGDALEARALRLLGLGRANGGGRYWRMERAGLAAGQASHGRRLHCLRAGGCRSLDL